MTTNTSDAVQAYLDAEDRAIAEIVEQLGGTLRPHEWEIARYWFARGRSFERQQAAERA